MIDNPLQPLRDDAGPGTGLTAEGLVRAGRRRVRRRRTARAAAAAALVLVVTVGVAAVAELRPRPQPPGPQPAPTATRPVPPAPTPSATPGCQVYLLAMPDGVKVDPVVVDATGHWAAGLRADRRGVVIWHDGVVSSVVQDVDVTNLAGISAAGVAAGSGPAGDGRSRAMTFQDDHATALPLPAGAPAGAATSGYGVNAGGDVVGTYDDPRAGTRRAVLWRHDDPVHPRVLATPAGRNAAAFAISPDGTVGGMLGDFADGHRPYLWRPDGTGTELPRPAGKADGLVDGLAGEWATDFDNGVRWRLTGPGTSGTPGTPAPIAMPAVDGATGRSLTADGTVLFSGPKRAVLWGAGEPVELPLPTGFAYVRARSASADGTVIGGVASNLQSTASGTPLLWRCGG
ncbi:hypothetical protein [Dactylosporangium sp. NPDC048998]|uniref:hypothetical protein n=1 Tax=Dactylosporangium sp. NPDC048998 TaxID=3363976 RepID=UPI0037224120